MKLRNRNKRLSNSLFGRFSYKKKIIIFSVLCVVVLGIVINHVINNEKTIVKSPSQGAAQETKIKPGENGKSSSQVDENTKKKEELNKALEEKCQQGKDAFFKKNYNEAIRIEDEVIKEDSNFYKAYNVKGITLCYDHNFSEGMKNIDKALELKPDFEYARFNKALAYELYGYYDDALTWYDKSLEIGKDEWSYYGKASIYGRKGDVTNTISNLKKAVKISPEIKEEAKSEKDFDPVRSSKEFQDLVYK